jgi:hypothetical protein
MDNLDSFEITSLIACVEQTRSALPLGRYSTYKHLTDLIEKLREIQSKRAAKNASVGGEYPDY